MDKRQANPSARHENARGWVSAALYARSENTPAMSTPRFAIHPTGATMTKPVAKPQRARTRAAVVVCCGKRASAPAHSAAPPTGECGGGGPGLPLLSGCVCLSAVSERLSSICFNAS